jgi:membrane protein implicated in regulation of membrane protease activity
MWALWWVWGAAAVLLAIGEVLLPSFVLLGFALGAAIVALLLLVGLSGSVPVLLLVFAVASLISWLALRRWLGVYRGQVTTFDRDINDN